MPFPRSLKLAALLLCSALVASCGDSGAVGTTEVSSGTAMGTEAAPAVKLEPADPAHALVRAAARWDHKVVGDWIQVYDYVLPELRRGIPLGQFLTGKEHHVYENPTKPFLLGTKGNLAYVEVTTLWSTLHPIVLGANNLDSPESLRHELAVVETWQHSNGEWYWIKEERQGEFFEANPDFLARGATGK